MKLSDETVERERRARTSDETVGRNCRTCSAALQLALLKRVDHSSFLWLRELLVERVGKLLQTAPSSWALYELTLDRFHRPESADSRFERTKNNQLKLIDA